MLEGMRLTVNSIIKIQNGTMQVVIPPRAPREEMRQRNMQLHFFWTGASRSARGLVDYVVNDTGTRPLRALIKSSALVASWLRISSRENRGANRTIASEGYLFVCVRCRVRIVTTIRE